jgi:hypothetical protein
MWVQLGRMKPEVAAIHERLGEFVWVVNRSGTWFASARTGRKKNPEALAMAPDASLREPGKQLLDFFYRPADAVTQAGSLLASVRSTERHNTRRARSTAIGPDKGTCAAIKGHH